MSASGIIIKYINFFESRGHKRIANSPLVPENDPTTLFTSAGMQPLIPYLLGESHPAGKRLVNAQNCFRAQDIDEVGDNRHITFFRMLGNWSLGDYFKKEQLPWLFEFLTDELRLDPSRLYVSVFEGNKDVPKDEESAEIWKELFTKKRIDPNGRIFYCGVEDNWWSRSGVPENMPAGEIGGPDSEVYYDLRPNDGEVKGSFQELSDSGRLIEIANSVFIEYQKQEDGSFKKLANSNVDFGGGLERLLIAVEKKKDISQTSLREPILKIIEKETNKQYEDNPKSMQIVADHFISAIYIINSGIKPANKEQGYILRRLIRRGLDNLSILGSDNISPILEAIVKQYYLADQELQAKFEEIKNTVLEEAQGYKKTLNEGKKFIEKELNKRGVKVGDELMGSVEIPAEVAFLATTSFGLGPTQLESLGYTFNKQDFAKVMEEHQKVSRAGATKKFAGGLADAQEQTVRGHTATHLMHQAIRDMLGTEVHQKGSNITAERVRFDFNFDRNLTPEELEQLENTVNEKIKANLAVHSQMMPLERAKEIGAIGLFDDKYADEVKVYMIGSDNPEEAYSKEFCGGPHVAFTGDVKSFKIIKQENIGQGLRRLYVTVG
ncbi:alanine--tRNA ligase [Candidatus Dojkabacteria bacterium]|uniref:alanine--tRNA ligase n=1 Tax=Candidatus Dojkabacteria bacterium TaxID=2099670 RepID=A0A5C7JBS0_9BACT|nr:MAG: alanine--tRNA ligase [Candidatus Dojkabacteria bacterium]